MGVSVALTGIPLAAKRQAGAWLTDDMCNILFSMLQTYNCQQGIPYLPGTRQDLAAASSEQRPPGHDSSAFAYCGMIQSGRNHVAYHVFEGVVVYMLPYSPFLGSIYCLTKAAIVFDGRRSEKILDS